MHIEDERTRKSLRSSVLDGASHASMLGFGESFFAAFAVLMRATNIQLALLMTLPQAVGALLQLVSNRAIKLLGSRKRLVASAALLQALMHIPIALTFFLGEFRVYHLIFFACLYWAFGMILGPAWNSWMGDITDEKWRGEYFGRRNKITGLSTFLSFLLGGFILQELGGKTGNQYAGFMMIFSFALAARSLSFVFLTRVHEPEYRPAKKTEFGFIEFLRAARRRNYGLFVIYLSAMNFSVYLSAPFFTPYMLRDLKMEYLTFTLVNASALIAKLTFMPVWGRATDSFGTKRVLSLTGFLMPVVPVLWLFSGDFYYLLAIQAYSGFVWAGFEISAFNFVFDTTTPQKRATCVAYYNLMIGLSLLTGSLLGGLVVRYNHLFWSKYFLVFLISGVLRFVASVAFLPRLREARMVEEIRYPRLFFKIISTMPTGGIMLGLIPFRRKTKKA